MAPQPSFKLTASRFRSALMRWNQQHNRRSMPWKGEKDAYRIWLSEIILQQTRVDQGLAYYERFVTQYPRITDLAAAPDAQVMKLWEGLGYYSRCRNLMATARLIAEKYNGVFPQQYDAIYALKGIGPYTAAAIASFAFNLPHAVVDGNVYRVLSRVFGIASAIDSTEGKKEFSQLAQELIDRGNPSGYNQAIMDFGATVCKPQQPACDACPFQKHCIAYQEDRIAQLPVKKKKLLQRTRFFYFFCIEHDDQVLIQQRLEKDVWQDLYQFPMLETTTDEAIEELVRPFCASSGLSRSVIRETSSGGSRVQQLSHQRIQAQYLHVRLRRQVMLADTRWVPRGELKHYPFARIHREMVEQLSATATKDSETASRRRR